MGERRMAARTRTPSPDAGPQAMAGRSACLFARMAERSTMAPHTDRRRLLPGVGGRLACGSGRLTLMLLRRLRSALMIGLGALGSRLLRLLASVRRCLGGLMVSGRRARYRVNVRGISAAARGQCPRKCQARHDFSKHVVSFNRCRRAAVFHSKQWRWNRRRIAPGMGGKTRRGVKFRCLFVKSMD